MKKTIASLLLVALCLLQYYQASVVDQDPFLYTDYSRLRPVKIERIVHGKKTDQLVSIVKEANAKDLTVSIAGQRHSQGGHTYYKDGIVLDMNSYDDILVFDPKKRTIRVQTGTTWKKIQDYINPYGLSVRTMQSQNIFSIGGSISINAHGRDIRNGSMINSIESFRLLMADGHIKQVSRKENAELFPLALGGYGLFGVILDVDLLLTEDELYKVSVDESDVDHYTDYFIRKVKGNPDIHMHLARLSTAPETFLSDMYAINYVIDREEKLEDYHSLSSRESGVLPAKLLFSMNRSIPWAKDWFWELQKSFFLSKEQVVSRNNALRSESQFMEYSAAGKNDVLQEYFIPMTAYADFIHSIKPIVEEEKLNLLNVTVRYVEHDEGAVLSYAKEDMFALVCLFHVPLNEAGQQRTKQGIQRILDEIIKVKGSYYLPYAPYPSREQFQAVYLRSDEFFSKKDIYDPEHRFMNYFYEDYGVMSNGIQ